VNKVSDAAERHAELEVKAVLKGLLRSLTEVRQQRSVPAPGETATEAGLRRAEVYGLNIAIQAIKRRIR
jgi:hypothetical protein